MAALLLTLRVTTVNSTGARLGTTAGETSTMSWNPSMTGPHSPTLDGASALASSESVETTGSDFTPAKPSPSILKIWRFADMV